METLKSALWNQFGAAIDALGNAIETCPEEVWGDRSQQPEYWYTAFHTLFWLDYYLSDKYGEDFIPPEPFGLEEMDPAGVLPPCVYTKAELLTYLRHGREKCRIKIAELTEEEASRYMKSWTRDFSVLEWLLYTLRHVQHHAGQLNLLLRQRADIGAKWVSKVKIEERKP
jgi:hypothetical protein